MDDRAKMLQYFAKSNDETANISIEDLFQRSTLKWSNVAMLHDVVQCTVVYTVHYTLHLALHTVLLCTQYTTLWTLHFALYCCVHCALHLTLTLTIHFFIVYALHYTSLYSLFFYFVHLALCNVLLCTLYTTTCTWPVPSEIYPIWRSRFFF